MADRIHTLVASTVSTVTIAAGEDELRVMNVDGAAEVFYRIGSDAEDVDDPTVDDLDLDVNHLPAAISFEDFKRASNRPTVVKLISSGTPKVAVSVR